MRTSDAYTSCSNDDKFNLIRYLLKDGQYYSLEDLTLLPLQNGSYIKFTQSNINSCEIYMMSPSKMKLFVGMEDKLLQTLPTDVQSIFEEMIGRGNRYFFKHSYRRKCILIRNLLCGCPIVMSLSIHLSVLPLSVRGP